MPPEAAARSAVIADTMLPAAPVTRKTLSLSSVMPGCAVGGRALLEADGPALAVLIADLDRAGIAQGFVDQQLGDLRRRRPGFEVDGLHQRVRPLAFVGLGEAGDGAAQRRDGSRLVVAVLPAEARRGDQEGARQARPGRRARAWCGRAT